MDCVTAGVGIGPEALLQNYVTTANRYYGLVFAWSGHVDAGNHSLTGIDGGRPGGLQPG